MKAKIIETGEIIDVKRLYPTIYSRLDCNNKIIEEYDEDEIEILPTSNVKASDEDVKLKNLYNEKIELFYKKLNEYELNYQKDKDVNSEKLFASIKSMFIDIFGSEYKK